MGDYIMKNELGNDYKKALRNRISLSILGAGINLAHSDLSISKGSKELDSMLNTPRYKIALSQLNTSFMPFEWKVFFGLAKHNFTALLFVMLKIIEYLRTHKK